MIEDLINIAKSFIGKTPDDFEHCHNWTDLEERLESKMRIRANKEKYEELVEMLKDEIFVEENVELLTKLKELL